VLHRVSVCRHAVSYTPVDSLGRIARGPAYSSRSPCRQRRRPSPGHRWVGVHDITFRGLNGSSLALRPACSRDRQAVLYVEGFDGFVTSTAAPTATGWSDPVAGRELHPLKTYTFARRTAPPRARACGYRPERVPVSRRVVLTHPRSILVAANALRPYAEGVCGDEKGVMPTSRVVPS
jgi:hypothetical protein